jgi:hypothetical protein
LLLHRQQIAAEYRYFRNLILHVRAGLEKKGKLQGDSFEALIEVYFYDWRVIVRLSRFNPKDVYEPYFTNPKGERGSDSAEKIAVEASGIPGLVNQAPHLVKGHWPGSGRASRPIYPYRAGCLRSEIVTPPPGLAATGSDSCRTAS